MAKRKTERATIIADFSTAEIPTVEGSLMARSESDDFRAEEIWEGGLAIFNPGNPNVGNVVAFESNNGALRVRRYTAEDTSAVGGIAVGLVRLL